MSDLMTKSDVVAENDRKETVIEKDVVDLLRVMKTEGKLHEKAIVKTDKGRDAGVKANRHGLIQSPEKDRNWRVTERGEKVIGIASEGATPVVKPGGDIGRK